MHKSNSIRKSERIKSYIETKGHYHFNTTYTKNSAGKRLLRSFHSRNPYSNYDIDANSVSTLNLTPSSSLASSESLSKLDSLPNSNASSIDDQNSEEKACCWDGCLNISNVSSYELLDHLRNFHVLPQTNCSRRKYFFCRWHGCRVYKTPSKSSAWLERHIVTHTQSKGKPFQCIFQNCSLRFATSELLERHLRKIHLQSHDINTIKSQNAFDSTLCDSNHVNKKTLRKKKKIRPLQFHGTDFFSTKAQKFVEHCIRLHEALGENTNDPDPEKNKLSHKYMHLKRLLRTPHIFMGQRLSANGCVEYLVQWRGDVCLTNAHPTTWVSEEDLKAVRQLVDSGL